MSIEQHDEWSELVVGRSLDALEPGDDARLSAHLAGCSDCRALLSEMRQVASSMAYDVADAEPPAELINRIRDALPQHALGSGPLVPVLADQRRRRASRSARVAHRSRPLLAAAAAVVVAVLVSSGVFVARADHDRDQTRSALQAETAVIGNLQHGSSYSVSLRSGGPAAGFAAVNGSTVDLVATGLDRNNAGTMYVLWAATGRGATMTAVRGFSVTTAGQTVVTATLPAGMTKPTIFGVTEQEGTTLPRTPGTVILGSSSAA